MLNAGIPLPFITVVTATFNALEGLKETVESVDSQTMRSVEHVIIDGGSSDGTREYLEGLGEKVRWVSERDNGIADAMNKGLAMAKGDYIIFLHAADTFMDEDSAATAAPFLDQDIVCFGVLVAGSEIDAPTVLLKTEFFMNVPHQGQFTRRSLFADLGGFDAAFAIAMDYEFVLRALRAGRTMRSVAKVLTKMDDGGVSSRRDWEGVRRRLLENRRVQFLHAPNGLRKAILSIFWALYLPFKRIRGFARF